MQKRFPKLSRLGAFALGRLVIALIAAAALFPAIGRAVTLGSWPSAPWNGMSGATSMQARITDSQGTSATFVISQPQSNVDVSNPQAPGFAMAMPSFFGVESAGFGVANVGGSDFSRGESFSIQADRLFHLRRIDWQGQNGDAVVHIKWTCGGIECEMMSRVGGSGLPLVGNPILADANTPVVITNVSPASAKDSGSVGVGAFDVSFGPPALLALSALKGQTASAQDSAAAVFQAFAAGTRANRGGGSTWRRKFNP